MLGENIRFIRNSKGLSLTSLSKMANMSKSYLSELENGKNVNPSTEKLKSLADALDVKVEDFYKENLTELNEVDRIEEDMRLMFSKIKSLSGNDKRKILDIIKKFEEESN